MGTADFGLNAVNVVCWEGGRRRFRWGGGSKSSAVFLFLLLQNKHPRDECGLCQVMLSLSIQGARSTGDDN